MLQQWADFESHFVWWLSFEVSRMLVSLPHLELWFRPMGDGRSSSVVAHDATSTFLMLVRWRTLVRVWRLDQRRLG